MATTSARIGREGAVTWFTGECQARGRDGGVNLGRALIGLLTVTFAVVAGCSDEVPLDATGTLPEALPSVVVDAPVSDPAKVAAIKVEVATAIAEAKACGDICAGPYDVVLKWKHIDDLLATLPSDALGEARVAARSAFDSWYSCIRGNPNGVLAACDAQARSLRAALDDLLPALG